MPLIAIIITIAIHATILHGSHPTCRSGSISVSFETSTAPHCIEYCGTRMRIAEASRVEIALDRCSAPNTFMSDGTGPYEIPHEKDSFGTAHVRLK